MKRTLLEIVQSILNDMDADEVSSITDTFEAEQVAIIVREAFFNVIDSRNWPHLRKLTALTVTDASSPSTLLIPDGVKEIEFIQFNKQRDGETRRRYEDVEYLYPDEFLRKTNKRNNDNANIEIVTSTDGTEVLIQNDKHPQWYTSFSDASIAFDSYDAAQYTFIPSESVQCHAVVTPGWTHTDDAVPDLPEEAHTLLLEEAKSTAFLTLKQMVNEKAESRAVKADSWLSRKAFKVKGGVRYPNYGRNTSMRNYRHPLDKDN